jgi:hypothetical protein
MKRKIKKLEDINLEIEEGELLLAAIGFITASNPSYNDDPNAVIKDLLKARNDRISDACLDIMKRSPIFGKKIKS